MYRTILLPALLALLGCRGETQPPPMAATPESSRAALTAALDGWKDGKSSTDFNSRSSRLYFVDDELDRGAKLIDYQIEGEGQPRGTGYSYLVTLTFQDKDGVKPPVKKKIAYRAVTEPKHAVTREDRQP